MSLQDSDLKIIASNLKLEEKVHKDRFSIQHSSDLKSLRREGVILHPIKVINKKYGFAQYPEFSFVLNAFQPSDLFRDGIQIELFLDQEEPIKGMLTTYQGTNGEVRLYTSDFPDWIEEKGVGIKLVPDLRTFELMFQRLNELDSSKSHPAYPFFSLIYHGKNDFLSRIDEYVVDDVVSQLNESQNRAVKSMNGVEPLVVLHGPPGTGKTTTLVEGIKQLIKNKEKVLVTAPSNAAVDHIALGLIQQGVKILRIGNTTKVSDVLLPHTVEGKLSGGSEQKQLKKLRIQAEEYRKMSYQYKRKFGKEERDQRKLLLQEVKNIRKEIRSLQTFFTEKWMDEAQVVCGTPVGLEDASVVKTKFNTLVIDEAGQCLEPMALLVLRDVERLVIAGDHLQLPPTVLSDEAKKNGFDCSFLEVVLSKGFVSHLLDTQYRMREGIMGFSNEYFYEGKLKSPVELADTSQHFHFIDTAGTAYQEEHDDLSASLFNPGELTLVTAILKQKEWKNSSVALISPYAGQVAKAKEMFSKEMRISTIDSFQGQEHERVFISLVRSNDEGNIGFLKDYRRLNVALTRAKETIVVIGDSVTLGNDPFFKDFIKYAEKKGAYQSAWEYMMG